MAAAQHQANLFPLISYGSQIEAANWELGSQAIKEPMDDQEPPCDEAGGPLWHSLDLQDNWKTSNLDVLVAYLIWAKMGLGFKQLAALLSIKKAKLVDAIAGSSEPLKS